MTTAANVTKLRGDAGLQIERGIPVPIGTSTKYPFPEMAVGDSIFVPTELSHRAQNGAFAYGKAHGWKFPSRTVPGGIRIWRRS